MCFKKETRKLLRFLSFSLYHILRAKNSEISENFLFLQISKGVATYMRKKKNKITEKKLGR